MTRITVETIVHADGMRRVEIFRRRDGSFGFEELRQIEPERAWVPSGHYTNSFCASAEVALSEARARVSWLLSPRGADD
jgi:hypothetical protein